MPCLSVTPNAVGAGLLTISPGNPPLPENRQGAVDECLVQPARLRIAANNQRYRSGIKQPKERRV